MTPPLAPLHPDSTLIAGKLRLIEAMSTDAIVESLKPGLQHSLKCRPDGTVLDGHHRLKVLRDRRYDVNELPRTIIPKHPLGHPTPDGDTA